MTMPGLREISTLSKNIDDANAIMLQLFGVLMALAKEFDERQRKLDIAKVSLSSTGVAGGVMTVVGLALAPVTFGASLGLTIAGGIVGGGSAVGNISALVADKIITKKTLKNAQNLLTDFAKRTDVIQSQLGKLIGMLNKEDREFAQTEIENCRFLPDEMKKKLINLLRDGQSIRVGSQKKIAELNVGHMISAAQILVKAGKAGKALSGVAPGADVTLDVNDIAAGANVARVGRTIGAAADLGTDAATTTGKVAASGAKAAGIALVAVGIAVDLGALVYYSHKIHKNQPSELAKKIRDVAECLK